MREFFNIEDFLFDQSSLSGNIHPKIALRLANAKLKREGVIHNFVYADGIGKTLCLRLLEDPCTHPVEKVTQLTFVEYGTIPSWKNDKWFQCECGVKVKPVKFVEKK